MTDIELLDQYARGKSREALGEIVRRHVGWVHAVARRRVGDTGLADDVTQAVFLVLAQKPPSVREERAFAAWLFSVANNACSRAIRGEMRRKKREKAFAMEHPEAGDSASEMSQDEWRELSPHLDEAVAAMSPEDREAILLRFYQQKSHADVAAALGIGEEAARERVQRAVGRLREILGHRGVQAPGLAVLMAGLVEHAVPQASAAIVQSALAATQGVVASAQVSWIAKGVMIMMTAKKATAAVGICLMALLVGGGATILMIESRRQPPPVVATTMPSTQEGNEVYIGGHVKRSGVYSIGGRLTSLRSLIVAAGIEDPATAERFVHLGRKGSDGKPYYPIAPVPLVELMAQATLDVPLQAGDEISVQNTRPTSLPAVAAGWRERFDQVYRLNDDELLKLIPPPYIPERAIFHRQVDPLDAQLIPTEPSTLRLDWSNDRTLSFRGASWSPDGAPLQVSLAVRALLDLKSYEVEAPPEFMQFEINGDWILRKDTTPEARLRALAGLVRQMGGPAVTFERRLLPRTTIVVNGLFAFQPTHEEPPNKTPGVHFYRDDAELQERSRPGTESTGTVQHMLSDVGILLDLPLLDQRAPARETRVYYYLHETYRIRHLPEGIDRLLAIRRLLDNVEKQTGLSFSINEHLLPVWVGSPQAGL